MNAPPSQVKVESEFSNLTDEQLDQHIREITALIDAELGRRQPVNAALEGIEPEGTKH